MDYPKSLADAGRRAERYALLNEPHVLPLTAFVNDIRLTEDLAGEVPYFDPLDGGTKAKILFILEAPGPKAVASGFISRNNPDESAKNMFLLLREAGFERGDTILWNIVPWYIGSGIKIRPANRADIARGTSYLRELLVLLKSLQCLVLVGQKAASGRAEIAQITTRPVFKTPHPSPQFVNRLPGNRGVLLKNFQRIRAQLALSSKEPI